jgi:hypothetical protein
LSAGHTFAMSVALHQLAVRPFELVTGLMFLPALDEAKAGQGEASAECRSGSGPGARGWSGGPLKRASA